MLTTGDRRGPDKPFTTNNPSKEDGPHHNVASEDEISEHRVLKQVLQRLATIPEERNLSLYQLGAVEEEDEACKSFDESGRRRVSCEILPLTLTSNHVVVFHVPVRTADDKAAIMNQLAAFGRQFGEKFVTMPSSSDLNDPLASGGDPESPSEGETLEAKRLLLERTLEATCEDSAAAGLFLNRCRVEASKLSVAIRKAGTRGVTISFGTGHRFDLLCESFSNQFRGAMRLIINRESRLVRADLRPENETAPSVVAQRLKAFAQTNSVAVGEESRETLSDGTTSLRLKLSFGRDIPAAKLETLMQTAATGTNTTLQLENRHESQIRRYLRAADTSAILVSIDDAGGYQPEPISIAVNLTATYPNGLLGPEEDRSGIIANNARVAAFLDCLVGLHPSPARTLPQDGSQRSTSSSYSSESVVKRSRRAEKERARQEARLRARNAADELKERGYTV